MVWAVRITNKLTLCQASWKIPYQQGPYLCSTLEQQDLLTQACLLLMFIGCDVFLMGVAQMSCYMCFTVDCVTV